MNLEMISCPPCAGTGHIEDFRPVYSFGEPVLKKCRQCGGGGLTWAEPRKPDPAPRYEQEPADLA